MLFKPSVRTKQPDLQSPLLRKRGELCSGARQIKVLLNYDKDADCSHTGSPTLVLYLYSFNLLICSGAGCTNTRTRLGNNAHQCGTSRDLMHVHLSASQSCRSTCMSIEGPVMHTLGSLDRSASPAMLHIYLNLAYLPDNNNTQWGSPMSR